ncbi:MAG: hypothetical protein J6M27_07310 [Lachnospiraceae bacterium]|nr:hypothetical protein [Lachnospiraceae bacterium]
MKQIIHKPTEEPTYKLGTASAVIPHMKLAIIDITAELIILRLPLRISLSIAVTQIIYGTKT